MLKYSEGYMQLEHTLQSDSPQLQKETLRRSQTIARGIIQGAAKKSEIFRSRRRIYVGRVDAIVLL